MCSSIENHLICIHVWKKIKAIPKKKLADAEKSAKRWLKLISINIYMFAPIIRLLNLIESHSITLDEIVIDK